MVNLRSPNMAAVLMPADTPVENAWESLDFPISKEVNHILSGKTSWQPHSFKKTCSVYWIIRIFCLVYRFWKPTKKVVILYFTKLTFLGICWIVISFPTGWKSWNPIRSTPWRWPDATAKIMATRSISPNLNSRADVIRCFLKEFWEGWNTIFLGFCPFPTSGK